MSEEKPPYTTESSDNLGVQRHKDAVKTSSDLQEVLKRPYRAIFAYGGMMLLGVEIRIVILPQSLFIPAEIIVMYTTWQTWESGEKRISEPKFEHCPFTDAAEAQAIVKRVCPAFPSKFTVFE